MHYITWAIVAMGAYGITAIFLKLALRHFPPEVALVITNSMLVLAAVALVIYRGQSMTAYLDLGWPMLFITMAGVALSVSIVSYYYALSRGPASVVVPIFAMNFAVASVLSILVLGEEIKFTRVLGMLMASAAIVLLAR